MTINNKLKKLRVDSGMSQRDLAYKAGISLSTAHNAEQENNHIRLKTAYKISDVFQLDVKEIWEWK